MAAWPDSRVVPSREKRSSLVGTGEKVFVSCDRVARRRRMGWPEPFGGVRAG